MVDEAQDLSPMQLRMLTRRSLTGSMTIVGDIAQSTGAWPHQSWDEVLEHLPDRRPAQWRELTVGYRIPAPLMRARLRVLPLAAPELTAPVSVRSDGDPPVVLRCADRRELLDKVAAAIRAETATGETGNVAVIVPESLVEVVDAALGSAGITAGRAPRDNLDSTVTIVPVGLVKGLEVDMSIVVDPGRIVEENPQGYRSLYVALTRSTHRMTVVVASESVPAPLSELLVRVGLIAGDQTPASRATTGANDSMFSAPIVT